FQYCFTRMGIVPHIDSIPLNIGMYLGIKSAASKASDTIGQVVAVLNTNFWLATHVTIITMGYAAGLLAMILGMVYVVVRLKAKLTGNADKSFFRTLTKMNYGVICFCLFFSIVGTVLGGIWANYSWGRFWGWDPKENGALLICIWTLVILHAKMGGMIKDMGIQLNAIVLGGIVCFSWWGVNNLGVGLHSYGFTEGVRDALWTAWGVMGLFIIAGMAISFFEKRQKKERRVAAA
ncbi:MAG: cytochrome c biogenesis protein CcsA, partial [Verrucomicrobiota bacterium]